MAMQKHDYERVSAAMRSSLNAALRDLSKDDGLAVADAVTASYRRLAAEFARGFASVNPRFRVHQFMTDALGPIEGSAAARLYDAVYAQDAGKRPN